MPDFVTPVRGTGWAPSETYRVVATMVIGSTCHTCFFSHFRPPRSRRRAYSSGSGAALEGA